MLRFATGVGATFNWILLGFSRWVPECPKQQFLNRPGLFIVHMVQGATMVVCNEGSGYTLPKQNSKVVNLGEQHLVHKFRGANVKHL